MARSYLPAQADHDVFRAIAHRTRRLILQRLAAKGQLTCEQLMPPRAIQAPTLSQHLRILRKAGLITGHRAGLSIGYRVNRRSFKSLRQFLDVLAAPPRRVGNSSGQNTT